LQLSELIQCVNSARKLMPCALVTAFCFVLGTVEPVEKLLRAIDVLTGHYGLKTIMVSKP